MSNVESLIGRDEASPAGDPPPLSTPSRDSRPWRERLAVLDALVDAALGALGTLHVDAGGRLSFVYVSPAVEALLGVTPEALLRDAGEALAVIHPDDVVRAAATLAESIAGRTPAALELRVRHPRLGERWVDVRAAVTDDGDGCALVHAVATDVTSGKRAELDVRARDKELDEAQRVGHIGSWTWDAATGVTAWSRELYRLHGLAPGGPVTRALFLSRVHPDDRDRVDREIARGMAERRSFGVEYRTLGDGGAVRWLHGRHEPLYDAAGALVGSRGTGQDVTDAVEAQAALRRRVEVERQLSELAAAAPVALCTFHLRPDGTGCFPYAAPGVRDIYGLAPEDIASDWGPALARIDPDDWGRVAAGFRAAACAMTHWRAEFRVRHPTRGELWVEGRAVPSRHPDGGTLWHGSLADVTERKRTELALASRERELAEAHRVARMGNWEWRVAEGRLHGSPELRAVFGLSAEFEPSEASALAVIHHDDRERVLTEATEAALAGRPFAFDFRLAGPEPARWIHCRGESVTDASGVLVAIRGISQDVTERKRAEESMRRIVALNPAVLYAMRNEGDRFVLLWRSGNLSRLTGDAAEGDDDWWWFERVHPDDRARVLAAHPTPYEVEHQVLEYRLRRADGRWIWLRDEKRLVPGEGGAPAEIVGAWSDVTARVELERQLQQSQKMEAIGVLAGGVAHDFNNLLTVIGASTELLRTTPTGELRDELLDEIAQASERAAALTRQLLLFSRHEVVTPRVLSPNEVLRSTEKLLVRLIGEDVRLTCRLAADAGFVRIDPGQLEQVVLNLAVNARDAMPRGGELRIETAAVALDEAFCRTRAGLPAGPYVRLSVKDTGCGMSPEVRARIFEPFFTTKGVGKGTGLGLATVFGVVTGHGGAVEVTSEPGQGSCFDVYLPAVEPGRRSVTSVPSPFHAPVSGETVLVVEDDKAVRRVARIALEQRGYRVIEAGSPEEALALVRRDDREIDLLLTDVVMPGMSGPDLAREIQSLRPDVGVLFMSGYVDDAVTRHGLQASDAFLPKPFTPRAIALRVRERLDARAG